MRKGTFWRRMCGDHECNSTRNATKNCLIFSDRISPGFNGIGESLFVLLFVRDFIKILNKITHQKERARPLNQLRYYERVPFYSRGKTYFFKKHHNFVFKKNFSFQFYSFTQYRSSFTTLFFPTLTKKTETIPQKKVQ